MMAEAQRRKGGPTPRETPWNGRTARRRRKLLDLSLEEVAGRVGVTERTLRRWEAEEHRPTRRQRAALSRVLKCTVAYLEGEVELRPVAVDPPSPPDR